MKFLTFSVLVVGSLAIANCEPIERANERPANFIERLQFNAWARQNGKKYSNNNEFEVAVRSFAKNKRSIDAHNKLYDKGLVTFKRALWQRSDKSNEEKEQNLLGLLAPEQTRSATPDVSKFPKGPPSIDWSQKGLVLPVEDQGWCSSCWAFSTKGIVEAINKRNNISNPISPQQLIDCSHWGTYGCNGGWPHYALDYFKSEGTAKASDYPYTMTDDACKYNKNNMSFGTGLIESYVYYTNGNETLLRDIVAAVGPISIVMRVEDTFWSYKSGIYYKAKCKNDTNHAMLLVGYGTDPVGGDYWLLKNSWGTAWGEQGYVRFARNRKNMCNIAHSATFAS